MMSAANRSGRGASASRYIARETALSAAINAAISVGFFLALFGFETDAPVWGVGNFAFDFLPQSFAVTFFASLVPALLARNAVLSGKIASPLGPIPAVGSLVRRSVILGLVVMLLCAGLWAGVLWLSGVQAISPVTAFALKVLHGGALGALVTRDRLQGMVG